MIWTYCILKHTLTHLGTDMHARSHTHCVRTNTRTIAAHTLESGTACFFYSMLAIHTQPFTNLYKHTVQIDVHADAHVLPLELSLSHTHTPTRPQSHTTTCQYCGQAFLEPLLTHSPPAVFGRQTMRNDSKWKCTTCSPIRPLSSKPNICVFLSVCTRLVVRSAEEKKKAPAYEKYPGMTQGPKPGFVKQQSPKEGASTAYTWSKVENNMNTWH